MTKQLTVNLARVPVLEVIYYVLKDAYAVVHCPTNQTGVVIDNSCFTLEVSGEGMQADGDLFLSQ